MSRRNRFRAKSANRNKRNPCNPKDRNQGTRINGLGKNRSLKKKPFKKGELYRNNSSKVISWACCKHKHCSGDFDERRSDKLKETIQPVISLEKVIIPADKDLQITLKITSSSQAIDSNEIEKSNISLKAIGIKMFEETIKLLTLKFWKLIWKLYLILYHFI